MNEPEKTKIVIDFLIKEYELLRQEILDKFNRRSNLIGSGVTALSTFIAIATIVPKINDKLDLDSLSFMIVALLIPLTCSLIISFWTAYSSTIANIGLCLTYIEREVGNLLPDTSHFSQKKELIFWENFLRRNNYKRSQELITSIGFVVIFLLIGICSLWFGYTFIFPRIESINSISNVQNKIVLQMFALIGLLCLIYGLHSSVFNIKLIFKGFSKIRSPL
ncbi:hypothetical protein JYQ62_31065 [Nostoc sp. UHCC 0702]|nr:hypothetical protein JYQ62_31065 [Nostoc sp. UHCC 0702]